MRPRVIVVCQWVCVLLALRVFDLTITHFVQDQVDPFTIVENSFLAVPVHDLKPQNSYLFLVTSFFWCSH